MTEQSCQNACRHVMKQSNTELICNMPILEGANCAEDDDETYYAKWGYHIHLRRCVPFYYMGCHGNDNNFDSAQACEDVCPPTFAPLIRLPRGKEVLAKRGSPETTLQISIRANPPATIEWFHKGQTLSELNPRYTMTDNYLQISNVADYDAGSYLVRAQNGIEGSQAAAEAILRLIVYPLFTNLTLKASKTLYQPGDDVLLPCEVKAYPPPVIRWYKVSYHRGRRNETLLEEDPEGHLVIETFQAGAVMTQSHLMIRNVTKDDSGAYKCEAFSEQAPNPKVSELEGIRVGLGSEEICTDRPSFTQCHLIVQYKFCGNKCKFALLSFKTPE